MKQHFEKQFANNQRVTEEFLSTARIKQFHSGRTIEAGDLVLYALIKEEASVTDASGISVRLITLHEDELNDYEYVGPDSGILPYIKTK